MAKENKHVSNSITERTPLLNVSRQRARSYSSLVLNDDSAASTSNDQNRPSGAYLRKIPVYCFFALYIHDFVNTTKKFFYQYLRQITSYTNVFYVAFFAHAPIFFYSAHLTYKFKPKILR